MYVMSEESSQATKEAYKCGGKNTERWELLKSLSYDSFPHLSGRSTEMTWEESTYEIQELGRKSKNSYQYDLLKSGGNRAFMES
jgi:hypothetical protein